MKQATSNPRWWFTSGDGPTVVVHLGGKVEGAGAESDEVRAFIGRFVAEKSLMQLPLPRPDDFLPLRPEDPWMLDLFLRTYFPQVQTDWNGGEPHWLLQMRAELSRPTPGVN